MGTLSTAVQWKDQNQNLSSSNRALGHSTACTLAGVMGSRGRAPLLPGGELAGHVYRPQPAEFSPGAGLCHSPSLQRPSPSPGCTHPRENFQDWGFPGEAWLLSGILTLSGGAQALRPVGARWCFPSSGQLAGANRYRRSGPHPELLTPFFRTTGTLEASQVFLLSGQV